MISQEKIILLHDFNGFFARAFKGTVDKHKPDMVDLKRMQDNLVNMGFHVEQYEYAGLDMKKNYKDWYVIYGSSEEMGLFYKSYIEDILLRLYLDGAILIPDFKYFRAHHNKSFSEMLRASFSNDLLRKPVSFSIGNYAELKNYRNRLKYPCVVKSSAGAGSSGVKLVNSNKELREAAKKMFKIKYNDFYYTSLRNDKFIWLIKTLIKRTLGRRQLQSSKLMSNKLIIQEYIPYLDGDYKVLFFCGKYYVLERKNRKNDFRASGSGKFSFPLDTKEIIQVLDFAQSIAMELKMPLCSLDIGRNNKGCFLIEFQCVHFGPYTLQFSSCYFEKNIQENCWMAVNKTSVLEDELTRSIAYYIEHKDVLY